MSSYKLLILDDDQHFSGLLALQLKQKFDNISVSTFDKCKILSGYDIYILDNDFSGEKKAANLAETIRQKSPESLVLILSATLEFNLLKRLVNCHAAGVFDKSKTDDIQNLFNVIEEYIEYHHTQNIQNIQNRTNITDTITGIGNILKEWNKKLHLESLKK